MAKVRHCALIGEKIVGVNEHFSITIYDPPHSAIAQLHNKKIRDRMPSLIPYLHILRATASVPFYSHIPDDAESLNRSYVAGILRIQGVSV